MLITRYLTVLFGGIQIAIGIAAAQVSRSVVGEVLAIAGFAAGLLLGLFALATFTKHVNQWGALGGLLIGLAYLLTVKFLLPIYEVNIAWPWLALIGTAATFLGGLAVGRDS